MRTLDALLGESPVFAGLAREQLELIGGCGGNVAFAAAERLFREGDTADTFFLVRHGLVELDADVPNHGQLHIETVGPGEIVGWSWLIAPYRWQFTGHAVEPVRAIQFDGACLRRKCAEDPQLGYDLMMRFTQVLVDRLQATRLKLHDLYSH